MTGALWPLNSSVYHIQTTQAETYAGTLTSQVLIGLHQPAPLMKVSSLLKGIVKRVYEVINIDVQGFYFLWFCLSGKLFQSLRILALWLAIDHGKYKVKL